MRLIAAIPILFSAIALVLSCLTLFAGDSTTFLPYDDILTLNTSRIAVNVFNTTTTSSNSSSDGGGFWSGIINGISGEIHNITDQVENDIETALNDGLDSFAKVLGLNDFYSIHVINYCEGYFYPNGSSKRNVTYCSNRTGINDFNPGAILQQELNSTGYGITLDDIHWPQEIDDAVDTVKALINAMFIIYCIAITATGLSFIGALVALFLHDRFSAIANLVMSLIAFLALLTASAGVTAGMIKAVDTINIYGADIDVSAYRGNQFLGMTWAATVLMFLASTAWVVEIIVAKGKRKTIAK